MVALGFEISVCRWEVWLGMAGVKIFPLAKSRRAFAPLFVMLDFWNMFFMSCEISSLPRRRKTALSFARREIKQSENRRKISSKIVFLNLRRDCRNDFKSKKPSALQADNGGFLRRGFFRQDGRRNKMNRRASGGRSLTEAPRHGGELSGNVDTRKF